MEIDTPRGRSANASTNSSRAVSAHSSISFILYVERIEAQSKNLSQADQVEEQETNNLQRLMLSYANPEVENNCTCNKTIGVENTLISNGEGINNTNTDICHL